jgi:hypothetical protein
MGFCSANLKRWLLAAGTALAVAYAAQAQHAGRRPGQAILFSSADDKDVSSNMPSLAAKPPGMLDFANAVQSPGAKSDVAPETELLPPQTPAISPAQAQQMQRLLDKRKNWALLTPEEIFGLPTPEKILHVPERDAFGQPKNETVVEKFYERQERLRARTNNDNYGAADTAPRWGLSDNRDLQMNPNIWTPAGSKPGNLALMNQFLNGTTDNRAVPAPGQAPESGWSKPFSLPTPPPGPTAEQQAAMEQFQQLLKPHSLTNGTAKAPALGSPVFSSSFLAPPNPAAGSSALIPMGASFTPLSSGIAMPAGVTPLPGILGPTNMGLPMFEPEGKPQLPPWQSSAPQLGAMPQRKF